MSKHTTNFHKNQDSIFFASSTSERKVAGIRGVKNPQIIKRRFKTEDFCTYRVKYEKGGSAKNKTSENVKEIGCIVLDIDWNKERDLKPTQILDYIDGSNFPRPDRIVKTPSKNHYQVVYNFPYIQRKQYSFYDVVREGLVKFFKPFDLDPGTTRDASRLTRNPYSENARVVYEAWNNNTLGKLYKALKRVRLLPEARPNKKRAQKPFHVSQGQILRHLINNQGTIEARPVDIYRPLNIPRSTFHKLTRELKQAGMIDITAIEGTHKYKFTLLKKCLSKSIYDNSLCSFAFKGNLIEKEIVSFNESGAVPGTRNILLFRLSRNLAFFSHKEHEILEKLRPGLRTCKSYGKGFSEREIEATVKSACNPKYKYPCSLKKLREFSVFETMRSNGKHKSPDNSQSTGPPNLDTFFERPLRHSEACDCHECIRNALIEFEPERYH